MTEIGWMEKWTLRFAVVGLIFLAMSRRDYVAHRKLARVTLPIWLYVAASGWLVYYMLYRMY